jgi:hypothetical protein
MMPLNAAQSQFEFFQFPFLDSLWRPLIRIFEPKSVSFGPQSQIENLQFPFLQRAADQRLICSTRFDNGLADAIPYVCPDKSGASLRACSGGIVPNDFDSLAFIAILLE